MLELGDKVREFYEKLKFLESGELKNLEALHIKTVNDVCKILQDAELTGTLQDFDTPSIRDLLVRQLSNGLLLSLFPAGELVDLIVKYKVTEAVPTLIENLRDKDSYLRSISFKTLAKLGVVEPLITNLADKDDYIRGKSLATLENLKDLVPLDPIIVCLFDEKYWIREIAASILRYMGKVRSPELFKKLCQILIRELSISQINNPETGASPLDYVIRLIQYHSERGLKTEFYDLIQQIKQIYEGTKNKNHTRTIQCKKNIFNLMKYFSLPEFWEWDEETKKCAIKAAKACWYCSFFSSQQIPLEEIETYFKTKDYEKFCWDNLFYNEDTGEIIPPIDLQTGDFLPEALEEKGLYIWGFCRKFHRLVEASSSSDYYSPRKLVLPRKRLLLKFGGRMDEPWFILTEVEPIMGKLLRDWRDWLEIQDEGFHDLQGFLETIAFCTKIIYLTHKGQHIYDVYFNEIYRGNSTTGEPETIFEGPGDFLLLRLTPGCRICEGWTLKQPIEVLNSILSYGVIIYREP